LFELLQAQHLSIMQQFRASAFYLVVHWHKLVRWAISVRHIILLSWLSVCQKLANSVKIWQRSDRNKLGHFWPTQYTRCHREAKPASTLRIVYDANVAQSEPILHFICFASKSQLQMKMSEVFRWCFFSSCISTCDRLMYDITCWCWCHRKIWTGTSLI